MEKMESVVRGQRSKEKLYEAHLTDFRPIPFFRQTQTSRWKSKRYIQYNNNQKTFAWMLTAYGKGKVKKYPVRMDICVVLKRPNMRSDDDNYLKSAKDALVKAQIIPDDNLNYIVESKVRIRKGDNNAVSISLYEDNWS